MKVLKIRISDNIPVVNNVLNAIKENDGYCPCKIQKTPDTKCMCKEFHDAVKRGEECICTCGLYIAQYEETDKK